MREQLFHFYCKTLLKNEQLDIQTGEEKIKSFLFADAIILYAENLKD